MCRKSLYLLFLFVSFCAIAGTVKAEDIWGEAEAATSISAPMQVLMDDPNASGGEYIAVEPGNNSSGGAPETGVAAYTIDIAEGGVYRMYLRLRCTEAGDGDDSAWVRIQGAALNIAVSAGDWVNLNNIDYQVEDSTAWFWKQAGHYADYPGNDPVEFTMDPGTYTVEIAYREDGLLIDGFLVTNVADVNTATLPDVLPSPGPVVPDVPTIAFALESYDMPGYYLTYTTEAHWGQPLVQVIESQADNEASQWIAVPSTDGNADHLSFELVLDTGATRLLRHQGYILKASTADGLAGNQDASWSWHASLADPTDPTLVSIESSNFPGRYFCHVDADTWGWANPMDENSDAALKATGTWRIVLSHPELAAAPSPAKNAVDVRPDVILGWQAGVDAVSHDVYFGTNLDDVAAAGVGSDLLVSPAQSGTTFDPAGKLALGTTYYWRIDEIDSSGAVHQGKVWSFESEPATYPVTPIAVSATTTSEEGKGPENLINGSGLVDGAHDVDDAHMWTGNSDGSDVTVEFEFDAIYKFADMQVWNYNLPVDGFLGFGVKDMTIEYSLNGTDWMTLKDVEIPRGSYLDDYTGTAVDLEGIAAKYVKFSITSNRSTNGTQMYGLSEVAFSYIPVLAREPEPVSGSTNVAPDVVLAWRPGREAVTHTISLGTDADAVAAGQEVVDSTDVPVYDTAALGLLLGQEYFWMITEVNEAGSPKMWDSDIWSFQTPESIVIDDMESYDDAANLIYASWIDGVTNGTGSQVDAPETNAIHGGSQSMPVQFGLNGAMVSEVTLTPAEPVNLTLGGAQTLVIWFRGDLGNGTPQLYAMINDTVVNYTGSATSLAAPVWKQWNIDISGMGSLVSLTLGVSGDGEGTVYFDDIALYRQAGPQTGSAIDPGTDNLLAYYPMSGDLVDATGNGYDGATLSGTFGDGPLGYDQAFVVDNADANSFASLDIGSLIASLSDTTFATWVNWAGAGYQWCRIFDFGSSTSVNMFLCPYTNASSLRFSIATGATGGGAGESYVERPGILSAGWHHVAVTIDAATMTMTLYVDGEATVSGPTEILPQDLGETTNNYIGKSQWPDPILPGSVDDFRIYNRALSAGEIQYLAGDR